MGPYTAFAVACVAAAVQAVDELDATPEDVVVTGVEYCTVDTDCTFLGDTNATCSESQMCACASYSGVMCHLPVDGVPPLKASLIIAGLMRNATCNRTDIGSYETAVKEKMGSVDPSPVFASSCGSVTTVLNTELTTATLDEGIAAVVTAMRNAATEMSDFSGVAGPDSMNITVKPSTTTSANEVACTENALVTFLTYDERCVVVECASGYILNRYIVAEKEYMTCIVPPTPREFGDDDLVGGTLAAVILGAAFIAAVAGAAVYFIFVRQLMTPDEREQNHPQHEPYAEENVKPSSAKPKLEASGSPSNNPNSGVDVVV
eukprot:TRINITY_DN13698_c0_g2_i1.p1 TRINITY_DN13698_c0_g2~~TRINITY_DN13698_c0_g2_i1.p1  ORF type:complete len:338 (+),score=87.70 TRINITY_DN13698_c0_g2_i1:58-1014(+)